MKLIIDKLSEKLHVFHEQQNCSFGLINFYVGPPTTFVGLRDNKWHHPKTNTGSRPNSIGNRTLVFETLKTKELSRTE